MIPVCDVAATRLVQYLASASGNRLACMWVTERVESLRMLAGHNSDTSTVLWHANRDLLASGSDRGDPCLCTERILMCRGHVFPVWDVAAAPLGQYFASASGDRTARVWITERAQSLRMLAGHHSDVSTVLWHPNGDLLASGSDDRTIRLWDVRDGRPRRILVGHGCAVSLQT